MHRKLVLVMFAATLSFMATAHSTWDIEGYSYRVDTLSHITAGPGTTETHLCLTTSIAGIEYKHNVYYTITEFDNDNVEIRVAKGGNHMRMLETVPDIALRMSKPDEVYFAGVNADFFNMSYPYNAIGFTVADGFLANYDSEGADIDPYYLLIDKDEIPSLVRHVSPAWFGTITYPDNSTNTFHFNTIRYEDDLLMYTPQWQNIDADGIVYEAGYSGTNKYGSEVQVRPVGKNIIFGAPLQLEVLSTPTRPNIDEGNLKIPDDGYVLSGHGVSREQILALKPGDIITAEIGFKADDKETSAKEVVGGFPRMLHNGSYVATPSYPEHLSTREPRSAVGYNSDKSKLVMLVVDGRKAGDSDGVTLSQLAGIMKNLGCHDAMNFDGGGSSTMYLNPFGLRNVPSSSSLDKRPVGTPRTVVNALFAVATAPEDHTVASIEIKQKKLHITSGATETLEVYGYNQYGVLIDNDLKHFSISVPSEIATVNGTTITGADGNFSGILTVTYGTAEYSIPVYLNGGGPFVSGITEIITDDESVGSEAEYFNMQGVRIVKAPIGEPYIERVNSKVTKKINF